MIETFLPDLRQPDYIHVLITSFRDFRYRLRAREKGFGQTQTRRISRLRLSPETSTDRSCRTRADCGRVRKRELLVAFEVP